MEQTLDAKPLIATVRSRTSLSSQIVTVIAVVVPPLGLLSVMGFLWGVGFGPVSLATLVVMYTLCGLGITVGFHRLFTHRSFETTNPIRALWAILGCMAMQGPLTQWVTDHRKHHALSDQDGDPHSPHAGRRPGVLGTFAGLLHAHVGWLFQTKGMERGRLYGRDLYADRLIRTIDRLYLLWVGTTLGIPFLTGYAAGWGSVSLGLEAMVWGGVLRIFLFQHVTWSINSICHAFGTRPYRTRDESRNVWLLALPSFGEAWHNSHHAFPSSAVHGLDPRQVDISALVIRGMERLGVAWDVRRPSAEQRARRRAQPAEA